MMFRILLLLMAFFLFSCKSFDPSCISDGNKSLTISFGDYDMKSDKMLNSYQLKTDGKVYKLLNWNGDCGAVVKQINENDFCTLKKMLEDEIIKTQSLNVQADTVRFVEYQILGTNNKSRAMWNPKYAAIGSKGYRDILDYIFTITGIML